MSRTITLFDKQAEAFSSPKPEVIFAGGIQCGKTTLGGTWLTRKICEYTDPEDSFIIAAPTYKTLQQATLRKFLHIAGNLGEYKKVDAEFRINGGGTVYIRTATDPESIEGIANVRAVWGDEAGLFTRYFKENLEGRAARLSAQVLYTTTPYSLNWLAQDAKDAQTGARDDICLVQLTSKDSPYFPDSEYEKQKRLLDPRRFAMKYKGQFGKMEGLVFPDLNLCQSIELPEGTRYFGGVDWGYTDPFCLTVRALTPSGIHYRVAEYYKTGLTITDVVNILRSWWNVYEIETFVCDPSQPANIEELNRAGMRAIPAENEIRLGIDTHTELIRTRRFWVFSDLNPMGVDEYATYHYPEPKELKTDDDAKEQLPVDANNHGVDADRYVSMHIEQASLTLRRVPLVPGDMTEPDRDLLKRRRWLEKGGSSRYG